MKRALAPLVPLLLIGCGTDVSSPASSLLSCLYQAPGRLAPAEVLQVRGEGNQAICLTSDDGAAADFLYIPFFATPAPDDDDPAITLDLEVTGAAVPGGAAVRAEEEESLAAPVLLRAGGTPGREAGWTPSTRFHDRLRRRELRELTPLIRSPGSSDGGPGVPPRSSARPNPLGDVPQVGDTLELNVAVSCTEQDLRMGEVMHVSDHAVVVADVSNPANLDPSDFAYFGITFDTLVYPVETDHFGEPADIDDNGRTILFFTDAVNARNPRTATSVTIGFFWSGDLFPEEETPRLQACPAANQAEMFYLIAPDPGGEVGPAFTLDDVRALAIPLIGHEFQHLINASRRLFINNAATFEEPWLNEGLSHIAEELLFYEAADLAPGLNLTAEDIRATPNGVAAFNEYMSANFGNFRRYLSEPDTASLMGIDRLSTRGAAWAFLRYAADRSGQGDGSFFFSVVNGPGAGLANLSAATGAEALDWMQDWTVSVYGDDFVPGLPSRFSLASWDLRAVYEGSTVERYPLEVRTLGSGADGSLQLTLLAGGAAYVALGVDGDDQGLIHVEAGGQAPPPTLRGSILRRP